ncbi:hypothetical protein Ait01nite_059700 [Actinoplanes italicus]|uniref:Actin-binding WH2 domain-containing protein n=1 Tax=Actinoplanes italicus TaxID=113567 RepID=A0A2T0K759_9ACTN|nr:hypothetical protein [Actinoplanes italicus]PRX18587.1 hypothetical protein CLV67_11261 [Actinoplanes italicus]GIE32925.1 hypothetical protein Ait01nite_059700 [Actinoplanes italicus]
MASSAGNSLLVIERLLRDRDGIWRQIIEERDLKQLTGQMLISSALSLALYGAVLGFSNSALQAAASFVKLPLLFLATLAICLPTLYLFNLVFGAKLSVLQALTLIMVTITVTAVLTLAFAPISLFFLITAQSYAFFKLLNVAILMLTALVGLRFLTAGMRAINEHQEKAALAAAPAPAPVEAPAPAPVPAQAVPNGDGAVAVAAPPAVHQWPVAHPHQRPAPAPRPEGSASMTLLYIWILLFGFVGTQLAWTLRPFFGSPGKDFQLFRSIGGTFYADVFETIGRLVG